MARLASVLIAASSVALGLAACSYMFRVVADLSSIEAPKFYVPTRKSFGLVKRPQVISYISVMDPNAASGEPPIMWQVASTLGVPLESFVYGQAPTGFHTQVEARALMRGKSYTLQASGAGAYGGVTFSLPSSGGEDGT